MLGDVGLNHESPYIPNLLRGAQTFGFLSGIDASVISGLDADLNSATIDQAPADTLLAIYRVDSLSDLLPGNSSEIDFEDHQWVVVVNLTETNLAAPEIGIGIHSDDTSIESQFLLSFQGIGDDTVEGNLHRQLRRRNRQRIAGTRWRR